jgi:serine/threonine protein kinase
MGKVYRAEDTRLGRDVAIKVLPGALAQNADRLQRFEQEAHVLGTLNNPNLLAIFDVGSEDGFKAKEIT